MSKRRLNNLLKRKLFSFGDLFSSKDTRTVRKVHENEFIKSQFRDISRLGGNLIVMRMGNWYEKYQRYHGYQKYQRQ